jgi:hypothetical protein
MKRLLFLLMFLALPAFATDRYISPSGSGACTSGDPCSWTTARNATAAGDSIIFKDGTYTARHTATCPTNAVDGTSSNKVTIRSENELLAILTPTGGGAFYIVDCDWWVVQGFRAEGSDSSSGADNWDLFEFAGVTDFTIKRNLLRFNNRYFNTHLIAFIGTTPSSRVLIEENELYSYHRHGLYLFGDNFIVRRNYANGRAYSDLDPDGIAGGCSIGYCSGYYLGGDSLVAIYPANNSIIENNISEANQQFTDTSASGEVELVNIQFLGNISIDRRGAYPNCREPASLQKMPRSITFDNFLILPTLSDLEGIRADSVKDMIVRRSTIKGGPAHGINAAEFPDCGDGSPSIGVESSILWNNTGTGVLCADQVTCSVEYVRTHGNGATFSGTTLESGNTTGDPLLGTCLAWQPDGSALLGAGKGGHDVGARILYRYVGGSLDTNNTIWDTSNNNFAGCITVISGVNSDAANSCTGVDTRLNINQGSCPFPAGYAAAASSITFTNPWDNAIIRIGDSRTIEWSSVGISSGNAEIRYATNGATCGATSPLYATVAWNATPYATTVSLPASTTMTLCIIHASASDSTETFTVLGNNF